MGAVHSVESCSSGKEQKKDDIFRIPSAQDLEEYSRREQAAQVSQRQEENHHRRKHKKKIPRSMPDANDSVQRKLGVDPAMTVDNGTLESSSGQIRHPTSPRGTRIRRIRQKSLRRVSQVGSSFFGKVSHAAHAVGQSSRRLLHPHGHHHHNHENRQHNHANKHATVVGTKVRGGVLLRGCHTDDEHRQKVRETVEMLRPLKGEEALQACGFEYRQVKLDENGEVILPIQTIAVDGGEKPNDSCRCELAPEYMTRFFHTASDTMITSKNRKEFIADGDMYV